MEWYFKNEMNNGSIEEFDGISLVEWTEDNKIKALKMCIRDRIREARKDCLPSRGKIH